MWLTGKRALVTGGGRGIGAAIARGLAAQGAHVTVTGRNQAELAAVAAEVSGRAVLGDMLDPGAAGGP